MKELCIKATFLSALMGAGIYLASHDASGQQVVPAPAPLAQAQVAQNYAVPPPQANPYLADPADPEVTKLRSDETTAERDVARLVTEYSRAQGEAARSKIKSSLATALEKEFDLQQKRRDMEVTAVEARIKKVRELMQKRSDARQSIIEKRADQLIREADGLGWTAPSGINLPNVPNRFPPSSSLQAR
jgi:hypothetical protein